MARVLLVLCAYYTQLLLLASGRQLNRTRPVVESKKHAPELTPALSLQNTTLELDCIANRSLTQQAIDSVYWTQKRRLEEAVRSLSEDELASWDTMEAWRIWELFPPIYNCPTKEKVGRNPVDGGKFVCGVDTLLQRPDCVVLSFGSNGEPSFEDDIVLRTKCAVHTFDPTLDVHKRLRMAASPAVRLHEYGLGAHEGRAEIAGFDAQLKPLAAIMDELRTDWIDLLKIDIEGGEWKVLRNVISHFGGRLPFTQLQVEFHFEKAFGIDAGGALDILRALERAGLRAFSFEYNFLAGQRVPGYLEYSFLNTKDCRTLV